MKYVMFTNKKSGFKLPVLFAEMFTHASASMGNEWVATSAGFINSFSLRVSGASESLQLKPAPDDQDIISAIITGYDAMVLALQDPETNLAKMQEVLRERERREPPGPTCTNCGCAGHEYKNCPQPYK